MISSANSNRLQELEHTISKCQLLLVTTQKRSNKIGWIRFLVFFGGIIIVTLLNFTISSFISALSLIPIIISFLIVSSIQSRILTDIKRQKKWIEIKKSYMARINLNWKEISQPKEFLVDQLTPTANDLDIIGNNSVHQLIDFSKTKEGSKLLRRLLMETPANVEEILSRQKLNKELVSLSHFRDKFLLVNYLSSSSEIKSGSLLEWLEKSNRIYLLKKKLKILYPLCIISLASIIMFFWDFISIKWMILPLIYFAYYFLNKKLIENQSTEVEIVSDELKKIINTLDFVENYRYGKNISLKELCSSLLDKKGSAVIKLKQVNSILSFLSLRSNPFVWFVFILLFPVDYFFAYRIEKYKADVREHLPVWLTILHNLEAFISLANYSFLNPDYNFPKLLPAQADGGIRLEAKHLSHPLISRQKRIANDYSIHGSGHVDIFTGSNMSGKSTFLRTVGVNICLTNAGAPVCAESFLISQSRLFTCIRVSDSVIDGISYFYAEVKRLKMLLDEYSEEDSLPILFLIDEIFKGTNNLERLKGSEAMIRALAKKNGAGLISTHDLELVKLADSINTVSNYHFREEIVDDAMVFDYKLRKGPCPTTNAIKIMQASGLPVPC